MFPLDMNNCKTFAKINFDLFTEWITTKKEARTTQNNG